MSIYSRTDRPGSAEAIGGRVGRALVIGALLAGLTGIGTIGPAEAACLPPELSVSVPTAAAGGTIVVTGVAFGDACNDVLIGPGPHPDPLGVPLTSIEIQFRQAGRTVTLGVVDAGADYTLSIPVTLPLDAAEGASEIMAVGTGSKTAIPAALTIATPSRVLSGSATDSAASSGEPGVSGPPGSASATQPNRGPVTASPSFTG